MVSLANFPMVSQLTQITSDGRASEDAQFECVSASIGAAILWYQGKTQWDQEVNPDKMKDAAYGEALRNSGTAARAYVDFCKSLGIHLYPQENADYAHAIHAAHQHIQEQKPVIFTRDDPYVDQSLHPDWTHVCVFFSEDGAGLTALDPYIGKPVYKTDAGWIAILRNSELWLAERIATVTIPQGWHDDGTTLSTASGEFVLGFRAHVLPRLLAGQWKLSNQPIGKQYYTQRLEGSNPALGGGDQIMLTEGMLGYPHDPQSPYEHMKNQVIEEYVGTELRYTREQLLKAYNLNQQLQAQIVQLQANPATPSLQQQLDAANQKLAQVKALVG